MEDWSQCRKILIIRPDNMGDVLMSTPAIRAIKESFCPKITLLTSTKGAAVAELCNAIDEVIIFDLPWVKTDEKPNENELFNLIALLKDKKFDGCIIFTVFSQNPLPTAMIAYLSGIPLRLAYCRENPYNLLTHWVPDDEPFTFIRHQVERDLNLVSTIGVQCVPKPFQLDFDDTDGTIYDKLRAFGVELEKDYFILHPGVSEVKRRYPKEQWVTFARLLIREMNCNVLLTGTLEEAGMLNEFQEEIGDGAYAVGGMFELSDFARLIAGARTVISVNTGTVHLAAAMQTPVVVLYAQTNPQHYPWMVKNVVLAYSIPDKLKSKNEVIRYVDHQLYRLHKTLPTPQEILLAVKKLLSAN
jgi:ADP-heptose:LPS heptosyltransferase